MGTHVDAPAHMIEGGRTVDQLTADELVLPMVVIDLSAEVAADPDTCLTVDHIAQCEDHHGRIADGSLVAFRSDWSTRWPDQDAMRGRDSRGVTRSPGWTVPAVEFLMTQRNVAAIGQETIDTDPGSHTSRTFHGSSAEQTARLQHPAEARVFDHDRYQVELLTNLGAVPPVGATAFVGVGKAHGATAFPARVLALVGLVGPL